MRSHGVRPFVAASPSTLLPLNMRRCSSRPLEVVPCVPHRLLNRLGPRAKGRRRTMYCPHKCRKGMGTNCARNHPKDQSVAQGHERCSCLHSRWVKYARRITCGARVHTAPRGWQTAWPLQSGAEVSAVHTPIYLARQRTAPLQLHSLHSATSDTPRTHDRGVAICMRRVLSCACLSYVFLE